MASQNFWSDICLSYTVCVLDQCSLCAKMDSKTWLENFNCYVKRVTKMVIQDPGHLTQEAKCKKASLMNVYNHQTDTRNHKIALAWLGSLTLRNKTKWTRTKGDKGYWYMAQVETIPVDGLKCFFKSSWSHHYYGSIELWLLSAWQCWKETWGCSDFLLLSYKPLLHSKGPSHIFLRLTC